MSGEDFPDDRNSVPGEGVVTPGTERCDTDLAGAAPSVRENGEFELPGHSEDTEWECYENGQGGWSYRPYRRA